MISIVIVSHSATLASGVREVADQMAQGKVPIASAGGMLDDPKLIGTDPLMIRNAIQSVYSDDGVLVLVDIGSAVMSAQIAIEQLSENQRANVHLCEAPLAEGAIAAAAQGMAGADLQAAAREAVNALHPKYLLIHKRAPNLKETSSTNIERITPDFATNNFEDQTAWNALLKESELPAVTLDGRKYPVMANVNNVDDARKALEYGADGIGLYRTEFLYMNRDQPPTEEEQYQAYLSVCQAIEGLPVTIRTLDAGGDITIPYLDTPKENNPYLGLRGIRYSLKNVNLFKTQLRAICRVSASFDVRLMYPMVAVPEEVAAANLILKEVWRELDAEGIEYDTYMEVGIVIEVPSTIFSIPELADHCNFFSIGTNDLTQYLLGMDRNNAAVAQYRSARMPSVQKAIEAIIKKSLDENIEIAMCGELAGDSEMTETLIHFGLEEFSMNPSSIPVVKGKIRKLHYTDKQINDASDDQWMIQHLFRDTGI